MTRFELLGSSPTPSRGAPEVAFERMDLAAVVVDRNDFVVEANRAAAELFDADSEELLGQTADEVVPGCASLLGEDAIDRQSTVEIGDEAFEVVVTPVTDPFGRTVSWIVTLSEISSYLRRQQRLEVINRTFRHDVKTKLQLLAGAAGIDDGPSDGRLETDLIEVIREIDDLSRKVRDIITIFELERESRSLPLSTVVRARVEESNREFPAANVSLSTRDEIDGVYVDEVARYVVDNVLENAIEHNDGPNPEASVTVTVDDGWATVTVADDGPGIDDTQLAVLRERRETDVSHLNGLGLWLAVWGVDMLDGEISFEENSPTGTVVTMRFPVRREATGSDTAETDPHAGDS
jgi:PAS domain S-box-containing protein